MNKIRNISAAVFLLLLGIQGAAETLSVPGYEIHYSVFPTVFLTPEVAAQYGIVRGASRALLNVSVRKPAANAEGQPQAAQVTGTVFDLVHRKPLQFQEIREQDAVYYLAEISHQQRETLYFTLEVEPDTAHGSHHLEFSKTLYSD